MDKRLRYRIVSRVLGLFFLTAAILKLIGSTTEPTGPMTFLATPLVRNLIIQFEFVIGSLLILGVIPVTIWLLTVCTFVVFLLANSYFLFVGYSSCGCFGAITLSPWQAIIMDALFCWPSL